MRGNWNTDLEPRVHGVPADAREIVEAIRHVNTDVRQRKSRFTEWDSATGLTATPDWIELTDATQSLVSTLTNDDDYTTGMVKADDPRLTARVVFTGLNHSINQVSVRIDPDEDGASGVDVAFWYCQLYQLYDVHDGTETEPSGRDLVEMHNNPVRVTAPGSVGQVDFPFTGRIKPTLERVPHRQPTIYVFIWGTQSNGDPATNYGWQCDTGDTSFSSGGVTVATRWMSLNGDGFWDESATPGGQPSAFPTLALTEGSFAAATATYTSDVFDLTAAPTNDAELVASTDTPDDSTVVTEWRTSTGPDVWTPFVDGDLAGVDNTARGGTDLSAFAATQTYPLRAILTPNTDLNQSPRLRALGVREVERWDLDNVVRIEGGDQSVDPVTMSTTPPTVVLEIQRTGNRDYEDLGTRLLSENHIAAMEFRIWWGHPDLARSKWMLWDSLSVENTIGTLTMIQVKCFSALDKLVYRLPVGATSGAATRQAYHPENESFEDAWRNIVAEIGLPDRLEGAAPDGTTTVSKRITDSWAKDEMQHLSRLDGGCIIGSQGRFKHVDMHDETEGLAAIIPRQELQTVSTTPGWDRRRPIIFARWDYDDTGSGFLEERRSVDATVLANVGQTYARVDEYLNEEMMRWLDASADVDVVAARELQAFATGVIVWTIACTDARPFLEVGDRVAAECDTFVARDPYSEVAIRGRRWGVGTLVSVDRTGHQLAIWLRSYADVLPVGSAVTVGPKETIRLTVGSDAFAFEIGTSGTTLTRTTGGLGTQGVHPGTVSIDHFLTCDLQNVKAHDVQQLRMRYATNDASSIVQVIAQEILEDGTGGASMTVTSSGSTSDVLTWTAWDTTWFSGPPTEGFIRLTLQLRGVTTANTASFYSAQLDVSGFDNGQARTR